MGNNETKFTRELFENPTAEYRGAPFWAWNTDLDEKELLWQIDRLKEMGFGGFFMHTRSGMSTEYLGKEFMSLVRACNKKAKEEGMLSYLYDEDRWPSGAAGGYVTKNKEFRQKYIAISLTPPDKMAQLHENDERDPKLFAVYDISFDEHGKIKTYKVISENAEAAGEKWYAYSMLMEKSGWYNGYTYIDAMNGKAVDKFIEVTHEAYKRELGAEFGRSVPAIFTDEPQLHHILFKEYARDGKDVEYPWTQELGAAFKARFGYDIVERMPEVIWDRSDGRPNTERYRFFACVTELFAENFGDKVGRWCQENNIALTGHYMEEPTLSSQMLAIGEAMRHYKEYGVPGIDMLCDRKEFTTAKQAQSAVHQCGRRSMVSELYGVTGWDFDFRGHKFQGDWQAALGVTLRVPHLSWVSMRGSAKRDYPASISYQSSWYKEYGYMENHFARINTLMTRGEPVVRAAVLHPIESAWITGGVKEYTDTQMQALDASFENLTEWLLRGQIDFDFFSESMLPYLYRGTDGGFCVGEMKYQTVIVPPIKTIRSTTLDALCEFAQSGGKIIVCGSCPECVDGEMSDKAEKLWANAQRVDFSQAAILQELDEVRDINIYSKNGNKRNDLIYALRKENENKYLFITHCDKAPRANGMDCRFDELRITIKGTYAPTLYDTISGKTEQVEYIHENGNTIIFTPCYPFDSFLYSLSPCEETVRERKSGKAEKHSERIVLPDFSEYSKSEPNVLVLDMPQYSRDGKHFADKEEMLRIDGAIRRQLGYPSADGCDVQPWLISTNEPNETVWLKFDVKSEVETACKLAYEHLNQVYLNGNSVPVKKEGWFVDKEIYTMSLPSLKKGDNQLLVSVPIGKRVSLENLFLLGDFGVETLGKSVTITASPSTLTFDSLGEQKMPFYGANITYKMPFECDDGTLSLTADYYIGALLSAKLDGKDVGKIVFPPYKLQIPGVKRGKHVLELTLFGTRVNTFGALHGAVPITWQGPGMWYTRDNEWSYEYCLSDIGIMKKPELELEK